MKTVEERFFEKVEITNSCWIWIAGKNLDGYGRMRINNKKYSAHRVSYTLHKGEIPNGLYICHTCDNPSCVNPEHLWAGTAQDNCLDKAKKKRHPKQKVTHCPKGHEYTPENTGRDPHRYCKECKKENAKKKKVQNAKQKN